MKKIPEDIKKLEERIVALRSKEDKVRKDKPETELMRASKIGFRIGVEMFSGVIVGAAIGYLLDGLLATKPWLMIVFMFMGGGAGILNVYRLAKSEENKRKE
ncbi:MAG: AtpZ/AtpI family protein [Alphaproteobacteria bacterium]|nr:AtpZ/AtpI family protein [Alphaproteobacteria bacterium]